MRLLVVVFASACSFSATVDPPAATPDASEVAADAVTPDELVQPSTKRRVKVSFNNGTRDEAFDDFAVLVAFDASTIDCGACAAGGADLRFFDSDGVTPLAHEIELFDVAARTFVWVRVPRIEANSDSDHIWMHYGDPVAVDGQDATGVWANAYRGVWHFAEDPAAGGAGDIRDSLGVNHGTATAAMTTADHVDGVAAKAVRLDGANNGIDADAMTLPAYTWSMWMRPNAAPVVGSGNHQPISNGDVGFNFSWDHNDNGFAAAAAQRDASAWAAAKPAVQWQGQTWYFVVGTYDGTQLCMYVNATSSSCVASGTPQAVGQNAALRIGLATSNSTTFRGIVDEIRVSSAAHSAARVSAEYASQRASAASPFVVFGTPEVVP